MRIRGFVLGVMLLAAVGCCMVQESIKQTQARYDLAKLERKEKELQESLSKLRAEELELRSPARLAGMVREKRMSLVALGSTDPLPAPPPSGRWPGRTMDEGNDMVDAELTEIDAPWDVASAGQW